MITLRSPFLELQLDPQPLRWQLTALPEGAPRLEAAGLRVEAARSRLWGSLSPDHLVLEEAVEEEVPASSQGPIQQVRLHWRPGTEGLGLRLAFALPQQHPLLLWRLEIENQGARPVRLGRLELLREATAGLGENAGEPAFYSNGWQSWSWSGVYGPGQAMRRTRLWPVQGPSNENPSTPHPGQAGRYGSDFFGILADRRSRRGWLAGFLSQKEQFGSLAAQTAGELRLSLWASGDGALLDPGAQAGTDWAVLCPVDLDAPDPQAAYLEAVARQHGLDPAWLGAAPAGWCSWYELFDRVSAPDISANLDALGQLAPRLPLDLVQIDDGFETRPGDWFDFRPTFPRGVAPLAAEIRANGRTPGLWLAPFIVHPRSRLRAEHPDWLMCDRFGRPASAAFIWNTFTTGLDLTHPAALDYTRRVVETAVRDWGFSYLKLDFLYAGALPGRRHDPTRTRAQALRGGLEALREAAGAQTVLLGCGAPLGPALGLFQAMRISCDVSGAWLPEYAPVSFALRGEPHAPSARNAVQNILTRAPFHRRWWINDPDCLLVRPGLALSQAELEALLTAQALAGGSFILSDNLPELPEARLRLAERLFPPLDTRPRLLDWADGPTPTRLRLDLNGPAGPWWLLACFNWGEETSDLVFRRGEFGLPPDGRLAGRDFWRERVYAWDGEALRVPQVPAHGVALLAVRAMPPETPVYLGSDLHISQGLEVAGWQSEAAGLCLSLSLPRRLQGAVELALPRPPGHLLLDGAPAGWEDLGENRIRIPVRLAERGEIRLTF